MLSRDAVGDKHDELDLSFLHIPYIWDLNLTLVSPW